jgi:hypothetical protein
MGSLCFEVLKYSCLLGYFELVSKRDCNFSWEVGVVDIRPLAPAAVELSVGWDAGFDGYQSQGETLPSP